MSEEQQRAAWSLIAATRLDTDEAVLDEVNASDGVAAADFVQDRNQSHGIELHIIDGNWNALFKADGDRLGLVRRFLRRYRHLPGGVQWTVAGVFQFPTLMAQVPEVAIAAVNLFAAGGNGNSMRFGVVEAIFARLQSPFAPRSNDLQFRSDGLVSMLKTDLIVALAGAAVRNSGGAEFERDFYLMLGDDRTRQRRAQQILVLIDRAGLHRGENVFVQEFLAQVFHYDIARAGLVGLFGDSIDVITLTDVGDKSHNVVAIVFVQPRNNDRSIKTTGICKYYFLFRHVRLLIK